MTEMTSLGSLGLPQLIGLIGFLLYIGAFAAVQFERMDGNGMSFSLVNTLAAIFVAVSLFADFNLASALIQGSWIVIGITGIATRSLRGCASRVDPG